MGAAEGEGGSEGRGAPAAFIFASEASSKKSSGRPKVSLAIAALTGARSTTTDDEEEEEEEEGPVVDVVVVFVFVVVVDGVGADDVEDDVGLCCGFVWDGEGASSKKSAGKPSGISTKYLNSNKSISITIA